VDVDKDKYELYNIKEDWKEEHNLAEITPEKAQELLILGTDWRQSIPKEPKESCVSSARKE
jgi:N-acetylgalactosamine-6-sulfatase